jgi:hypothetical protein
MPIDVPKFISDNARRGLDYNREGKGGDGMTDKTLREAREMADGSVSEDKVRRMGPWFARHRVDMDAPANDPGSEDFPGKGAVAWLIWGGSTSGDIMDAAKWAERTVERLDREQEQSAKLDTSPKGRNHMDTIEARLAAALEGIAAKEAEVADARATAESVVSANLELMEKLKVAEDKLAAIEAEKVALAAKVEAAAETAVTASEEAAKIAASVGVAPVETNPAADASPKADVLETYLALSGQERAAFFAANRAAIMGALRK